MLSDFDLWVLKMSFKEQMDVVIDLLQKQNDLLTSFVHIFVSNMQQSEREIPFDEEGACPKCHHLKVVADGDFRQCQQCKYLWRVKKEEKCSNCGYSPGTCLCIGGYHRGDEND